MTIEQMRQAVKDYYHGSTRFDKMPDGQIYAIYLRLKNKGSIR